MASSAWAGKLTKREERQIERVQKCALSVILGKNYVSYKHALTVLNMKTLHDRRITLCTKFATKAANSDKYKHWFVQSEPVIQVNTRNKKTITKYKQPEARTVRFAKSPIPFLTNFLNEKATKK